MAKRKEMLKDMPMPSKESEEDLMDLDMMAEEDMEYAEGEEEDMGDEYPMAEDEMVAALEAMGYTVSRDEGEEEEGEEVAEEDMEYEDEEEMMA